MNNRTKNFRALVAKMDALKETEQSKLNGGVSTLTVIETSTKKGTNGFMCSGKNMFFPGKSK